MNTLATSNPSSTEAVTSVLPRPVGRPSGYSEETVGRLCEVIRRRGLSDGKAAVSLGIAKQTISRWKQEHPELEEWLAMAREEYRDAKLAIVDEAKTADGRPEWKAAIWALEKAFPEDYGRNAGAGKQGAPAAPFPQPAPGAGMGGPTVAEMCALIQENLALREQLQGLLPGAHGVETNL